MSGEDHNPLRLWALQIKREIQKKVPEVTAGILFEALVAHDTREVYGYYFKYEVPKDADERNRLDLRLHTLKYIADSLMVN